MSVLVKVNDQGVITANNYKVVNLRKPFRSIVDRSKSKKSIKILKRKPSETLSSNTVLSYSCEFSDNYFGRLYRIYPDNFKCHAIYQTNKSVSSLLRIRAIESTIEESEYPKGVYKFLSPIINSLIDSYDFEVLISDFNTGDVKIPVINSRDWIVNKPLITTCADSLIINSMMQDQQLPLRVCNNILKYIPLSHTNIDFKRVDKYQRVLVLSENNGYYSSYLSTELYNRNAGIEVLPVVLFLF